MTPPLEPEVPPIDNEQIVDALDWLSRKAESGHIDISLGDDEDWRHFRTLITAAKQALT